MKPPIPARIESINRLPWPLLTTAITAVMSWLRRNSMTCDNSASLASTNGASASRLLWAALFRVSLAQFFQMAADAVTHCQIRF